MKYCQELLYLKEHIRYYISDLLDNVILDSDEDPEYSAVTLCNLIYCYQKVFDPKNGSNALEQIKKYILETNHTINDFETIVSKFKIESEYYIGDQLVSFDDNNA